MQNEETGTCLVGHFALLTANFAFYIPPPSPPGGHQSAGGVGIGSFDPLAAVEDAGVGGGVVAGGVAAHPGRLAAPVAAFDSVSSSLRIHCVSSCCHAGGQSRRQRP